MHPVPLSTSKPVPLSTIEILCTQTYTQVVPSFLGSILTPELNALKKELNSFFRNAFKKAIKNKHTGIAKALLRRIYHPSEKLADMLPYASQEGNIEAVQFLLANTQITYSDEFDFAVRGAAVYGYSNILKLLLDTKIPVGVFHPYQRDDGFTFRYGPGVNRLDEAFEIAAGKGYTDVCKVILESGRSIGKTVCGESYLETARDKASVNGHREIVEAINSYMQKNQIKHKSSSLGFFI